jgi:aspartyl-tRNA(Asn)/glutamyl-tRNA(Gln) amidotransferase subunit B
MKQKEVAISEVQITPARLAELVKLVDQGKINSTTAKSVLAEMFASGETAQSIIARQGLGQISDHTLIASLVQQVLEQNPQEVASYLEGKETVSQWFFGQVMRLAKGQANPKVLRAELEHQLSALKANKK